jgi:hypothetical protein
LQQPKIQDQPSTSSNNIQQPRIQDQSFASSNNIQQQSSFQDKTNFDIKEATNQFDYGPDSDDEKSPLKKELGNTSFVVSSSGGGADQNCM